jgi:glycine/D-amino acid oxidase-like deaminating enzyme
MKTKPHIAVIGAGAFGGWTALHLLERGARVTLLDAWGPGNSRASSGGETRVMRGTYGPDQPYTEMAARALKLWAKFEQRWKRQFLHRTGVLWMAGANMADPHTAGSNTGGTNTARPNNEASDDGFERGSIESLRAAKITFQELSSAQMKKRWPQINFEGITWGIFEPECGYLDARASCQAVVDAFVAAAGKYRQVAVQAQGLEDGIGHGKSRGLALSDGSRLKADRYVFACGPWLGKLFPQAVGRLVQTTKQDMFFFGTPAGDDRFSDEHLPVWGDHLWGDHGGHFFYGIPGRGDRGFKIADDTRGPAFDPTSGERVVSPETLKGVREYLGFRFPALKDAPLVETRVCQYEETPDGHFIVDRHPQSENIWIVGGGSGHGFKHGPAVGEMVAELVLNEREADAIWRLGRFKNKPHP